MRSLPARYQSSSAARLTSDRVETLLIATAPPTRLSALRRLKEAIDIDSEGPGKCSKTVQHVDQLPQAPIIAAVETETNPGHPDIIIILKFFRCGGDSP